MYEINAMACVKSLEHISHTLNSYDGYYWFTH